MLIRRAKRRFKQAGDTIVEVMIALAVISSVLAGAYATSTHSIASEQDTQEHSQALQMVQGQLELLRAYLQTNGSFSGTCFAIAGGNLHQPSTTASDCVDSSSAADYKLTITPPDASDGSYKLNATWTTLTGSTANVTLYYRVYQSTGLSTSYLSCPYGSPVATPDPDTGMCTVNTVATTTMQCAYGSTPTSTTETGLVADWGLNGDANDSTGSPANGTASSTTTVADHSGTANSALQFNGTTSHVYIPDASKLSLGTGDFSVAVRFKVDSVPAGQTQQLFVKRIPGGASYELQVLGNQLQAYDNSDASHAIVSSSTVSAGAWHQAVFTRTSGTLRLYLDGASAATPFKPAATTASVSNNAAVGIGYDASWDAEYLKGTIDDARVYNRALSSTDVILLNSLGSTAPYPCVGDDDGAGGGPTYTCPGYELPGTSTCYMNQQSVTTGYGCPTGVTDGNVIGTGPTSQCMYVATSTTETTSSPETGGGGSGVTTPPPTGGTGCGTGGTGGLPGHGGGGVHTDACPEDLE